MYSFLLQSRCVAEVVAPDNPGLDQEYVTPDTGPPTNVVDVLAAAMFRLLPTLMELLCFGTLLHFLLFDNRLLYWLQYNYTFLLHFIVGVDVAPPAVIPAPVQL